MKIQPTGYARIPRPAQGGNDPMEILTITQGTKTVNQPSPGWGQSGNNEQREPAAYYK